MRYLILSDIHANREALDAVLADAEGLYGRIVCCGDIVGYGADPKFVLEWFRNNATDIVRGNHDKACCGLDDLEWFNPAAKLSALWTMEELGEIEVEYLRALPKGPLLSNGFEVVHGSPLDEDEYLISIFDTAHVRPYLEADVTFFGHTHLQGGFSWRGPRMFKLDRPGESETERVHQLEPAHVYLINPGSVGQPRDRDPRAAYALYASEERTVTFRRVEYDLASAQGKIRRAGLPEFLAERLGLGQ